MPVVVGLTFPMWHDNAAAAVVDGKLVFATEEERYTRHKHSSSEPPVNSLVQTFRYLRNLGIGPRDINAFALHIDFGRYPLGERRSLFPYTAYYTAGPGFKPSYAALAKAAMLLPFGNRSQVELARAFLERVYKRFGDEFPADTKIIPVRHHLAHAASAYCFSGFSSCAVLSIDGWSERDSTSVWSVKNGEFERVAGISYSEGSIGHVYDSVSARLGFESMEGPGKVMGLAPYGHQNEELRRRFGDIATTFDSGDVPYSFSKEFKKRSEMYDEIANHVTKGLDLAWNPRGAIRDTAANVAWNLQEFTERLILGTAMWAKNQTGEGRIALAGGVALNSKANMELHYTKSFEEMFVFPAANDAGTAIGAAAYVYRNVLGWKMSHGRLRDVYLGPESNDSEVERLVKESKWEAQFVGDDVNPIATLLQRGSVIAWYQGRSEFGPRALGNRSMVADPSIKGMWTKVNEIKGRETWRPLAPSVLDRDKDVYFDRPSDERFMVTMFRMTEEGASKAPAVCHVDGTARPQIVTSETNKLWYGLIKAFSDLSGVGAVLNTSFNLAGEPLVQTPAEALRSFAVSGLDAIYLQGWLIRKRNLS